MQVADLYIFFIRCVCVCVCVFSTPSSHNTPKGTSHWSCTYMSIYPELPGARSPFRSLTSAQSAKRERARERESESESYYTLTDLSTRFVVSRILISRSYSTPLRTKSRETCIGPFFLLHVARGSLYTLGYISMMKIIQRE